MRIPKPARKVTLALPATLISGSGNPTTGRSPVVMAALSAKLKKNPIARLGRQDPGEASLGGQRDLQHAHCNGDEQQHRHDHADKPEFLAELPKK